MDLGLIVTLRIPSYQIFVRMLYERGHADKYFEHAVKVPQTYFLGHFFQISHMTNLFYHGSGACMLTNGYIHQIQGRLEYLYDAYSLKAT